MTKFINSSLLHWQTTVSGLLTLGLVVTGSMLAVPQAMPKKTAYTLMVIQGIAKGWLSMIQQDAGKTLADVPGEVEPKVVASHEIPDNPDATPVKE